MKQKFTTKLLLLLLTLGLFFGSVQPVLANSESVRIDKDLALADALIHRQDGLGTKLQASTDTAETTAEEEIATADEVEKPVVREYESNNAPNRIVVTIKNNPETTRAFNWFTTDKLESFVLVSANEDMRDAKQFPAMVQKKPLTRGTRRR